MIQLQIHIIQLSTIQNQGQNKKSKKSNTENYPKNFQTKSKVTSKPGNTALGHRFKLIIKNTVLVASATPETRSKASRHAKNFKHQRSQISDRHWPIIYIKM
jgi:hypothetical protein